MTRHTFRTTSVVRFLFAVLCILGMTHSTALHAATELERPLSESAPPEDSQVRALVISELETTISSEVAAKITSITKKPGERFKKGKTILSFDNALFAARLQKARVDLDTARKVFEANTKLMQFKSISELELITSKAKVEQARAEVRLYSIQLSKCTVTTPFSGRVVERLVSPHQYVQEGTPLLTLVDDRNLSLQMFVPSPWVRKLKQGMRFSVEVDELGITCPARITTLGARIDSNSRTIEVRAEIEGDHPGLLPGMSGTARFATTFR
jgi:RND family efflux transporter MFP subunit